MNIKTNTVTNESSIKALLRLCLFTIGLISYTNTHAQSIQGTVTNQAKEQLEGIEIILDEGAQNTVTTSNGQYQFTKLSAAKHELIIFADDFKTQSITFDITNGENLTLDIQLDSLEYVLDVIEVEAEKRETFGLTRLKNVEGFAIYSTRKSEVINMENTLANLAVNNAREIYKNIAGLNIWESDGAGLQLSIGARGLDPNRTSNFNTRQNGYDISADALGYPESYYTPPTQALRRIEVVRGAASLQYGPQFGGLLNFVLKKGNPKKKLEFTTENTVGAFGLFNTFNSLGGEQNGWNYYAYFQRKQGDGWRENSSFFQNNAYVAISKSIGKKIKIGGEFTRMNYLAQQAGGLKDFQFENDNPRESFRDRNWFQVNWNLAALTFDWKLSDKTKLNSRSFFLNAGRDALGELGPIDRPDPLRERDLIEGVYQNFGNETRLIHRYEIAGQLTTLLIGARYYKGYSESRQGAASDGSDADFRYIRPSEFLDNDYQFPSQNIAAFAENLFNITKNLTITPGLRFEHIKTASEGYFTTRVLSGGQVIIEDTTQVARQNGRSLLLAGLGVGYKLKDVELYVNGSQNYRSINFSDLAISNPNLLVDSLLQDEKGFNADIGMRGTLLKEAVQFDLSLFYLQYNNRIGLGEIILVDSFGIEKPVAYRTNIGDAGIVGLESYVEVDVFRLLQKDWKNLGLSVFTNFSMIRGRYESGSAAFQGNRVELIPPRSFKTGLSFRYKNLRASYQYAYTATHFTDATNAILVSDATRGIIPQYSVQDVSVSWTYKWLKIQSGVNNLTNESYFTRRATAYPGPGIIPAEGRSWYVTVGAKF